VRVRSRASGPGHGFMRRPALVARLAAAGDRMVALIVAPAGYGKSSLLHEWSEHDDRRFVWLHAAELASPVAQDALEECARAEPERAGSVVVTVDDAHLAPGEALRHLVETVLPTLPAGSAVALAANSEPDLPIGRMRAHRALIELGTDELELTTAEAAIVMRRAGLDLDFDSVQALVRRTEGWPVGLYLGALSLRASADLPDCGDRLRGDDHLVAQYLRDEVLAAATPESLDFMIQSSVLDELSGPLCDAVLRRADSARMLGELARENLFLRPVDPAHDRYRWHTMFREALQGQLRRTRPALERGLHRRASAWLRSHGDAERAIDHAVAADDEVRTGDLLWANLAHYVGAGRGGDLQRWLTQFEDERIAGYAPLALAAAHSSLAIGDAPRAQRWRLAACAELERGGGTERERSMGAAAALIEAMSTRAGIAGMADAAARAYELAAEGSAWHPAACLVRGVAAHLGGARDRAMDLLEEGMELGGTLAPAITALCGAQRAMIAIERGDWESAGEFTDTAMELVCDQDVANQPLVALVFAASAAVRARGGRADEAKQDLGHGVHLLAELGDAVCWYGAETRILLAHAALGLADVVRARSLLAEASRLARRTHDAVIFQRWFDDAWAHIDTLAENSLSGPSSLTIAELRILRFLPSHRSFREIALQLGVSANTVKTQAHAIYRKLGVASRSEAVSRASESGLLGH
jgi:LuxR family maltose regulon positive regulatory protein